MNREATFLDQVAAFLGRPHTMPVGEYAAVEDRIAAMARRAGLTFDAQVAILRGTLDAMREASAALLRVEQAEAARRHEYEQRAEQAEAERRRRFELRAERARRRAKRGPAPAVCPGVARRRPYSEPGGPR